MRTFLFVIAACIAVSFAADCNNPLLKQANNPLITSTAGILTTPVTAADPLKFCPRLAGKQICCDATAQDNLLAAFKAKYQKFEKGRKEQVSAMDKVTAESESNESSDAGVQAEYAEIVAEATEPASRLLEEKVALRALRFLETKPAKGEKGAKPAKGEASGTKGEASAAKREKKSGDLRTDAQAAAGKKKGRGASQRKDDISNTTKTELAKNKNRTMKAKNATTDLKKEQAKCFKRVFKFAAGMMCLACDADYASVVSTAADGTVQIKVQSKSCDNLMTNCYGYMTAREEAGKQTKEALTAKKMRKKKVDLEGLAEKLSACMDDATCSASDQLTKLTELQTKMAAVASEKSTDADKKELEGEANMMVQRPSSCTSETNCKYICEEFVGVDGAKEEAVDLKKATQTGDSARRMLASSSLVYGTSGYEADSDKNSVGGATETYTTDAGFPEAISGAGYFATSFIMLLSMLAIVLFN